MHSTTSPQSEDNARVYINRGLLNLKRGNLEQAVIDFTRGCDMGYEAACERRQRAIQSLQRND